MAAQYRGQDYLAISNNVIMKKFFQHFFVLPFLWMTVPTWPVWASGDCRGNARALLSAEKHLSEFFGDLTTLTAKRELYFFEIETFQFEYSFFTPKGQQLDFVAKPPDYYDDAMALIDRNSERVLDFDASNAFKTEQFNVSARGETLGTIVRKPISYANGKLISTVFELYSAQGDRKIGNVFVPHREAQIFPLLDSQTKRIGKIFNNSVSRENRKSLAETPESWKSSLSDDIVYDDTFLLEFPENWKKF